MLLHRYMFYVYSMSCTDGTKSKYENTLMTARLRKVLIVRLTVYGHTYAIYKLIDNTCTNFSESESTFDRFKVMESILKYVKLTRDIIRSK